MGFLEAKPDFNAVCALTVVKTRSDSVGDIDDRLTNGGSLPKTELGRGDDEIVERKGTKTLLNYFLKYFVKDI